MSSGGVYGLPVSDDWQSGRLPPYHLGALGMQFTPGPRGRETAVAGSGYYGGNIRAAYLKHPRGDDLLAVLVPEPENPHDRHAIRVDIVTRDTMAYKAGYLPGRIATISSARLNEMASRRLLTSVPVIRPDDRRSTGIDIDLDWHGF